MCNRRCQFNVAHAFATHFLQRDFHTTFFADNAAIFHPLIFAAQTFVVFDRSKNTRTEQAVTFWFERAVVDGFGLLDLTEGPRQDPFGGGQRDLDFVKRFRRCDRVKRVVCKFLVHIDTFSVWREGRVGRIFTGP